MYNRFRSVHEWSQVPRQLYSGPRFKFEFNPNDPPLCHSRRRWREEGGKQPYYFSRKDGKPLMLAGIWDEAEYKGDKRIAFAILTEEPNELIVSYHDRMPLALADDKIEPWLDLSQEPAPDAKLLLDLNIFAVRSMDRAMNNVRQKDLVAIDPKVEAA